MIFLKNNYKNQICVTLSENILNSITGTTFTLNLKNDQDLSEYNYNLTDISSNIERYNEFELTLTGNTNLSEGYYSYIFTQSGGTEVLETGRALVNLVKTDQVTYKNTNPNNDFKVYKK